MFLSELVFYVFLGSSDAFWLARFLPLASFLQLWVVGHGDFPRSVFSLGRTRVLPFPSVFCGWRIPFGATSDCGFRAVDSAFVLLSSHFRLSTPAFFSWRAVLLASSPLESGCFVVLACDLGGVCFPFTPDHCVILATVLFS